MRKLCFPADLTAFTLARCSKVWCQASVSNVPTILLRSDRALQCRCVFTGKKAGKLHPLSRAVLSCLQHTLTQLLVSFASPGTFGHTALITFLLVCCFFRGWAVRFFRQRPCIVSLNQADHWQGAGIRPGGDVWIQEGRPAPCQGRVQTSPGTPHHRL